MYHFKFLFLKLIIKKYKPKINYVDNHTISDFGKLVGSNGITVNIYCKGYIRATKAMTDIDSAL